MIFCLQIDFAQNFYNMSENDWVAQVKAPPKIKSRYSKHKTSLEKPSPQNSTTLSTHFHKEKAAGRNPVVSWRFIKTNIPSFNPVTGTCKLCISEKFHILFKPDFATLNSRSEIFTSCRHKKSELLVPPDPKSQGG